MQESINPIRNNINSSRSPKNGKISNGAIKHFQVLSPVRCLLSNRVRLGSERESKICSPAFSLAKFFIKTLLKRVFLFIKNE